MTFVMGVSMLKVDQEVDGESKAGKWVLFVLPLITVLKKAWKWLFFFTIYQFGSQSSTLSPDPYRLSALTPHAALTVFLIIMTMLLVVTGTSVFSKDAGEFEGNTYAKLLSDDTLGDEPGSYRVQGNVWHLACCSHGNNLDGQGQLIFGAIFGWSNNGSLGTISGILKFKEGRAKLFEKESAAAIRRHNLHRKQRHIVLPRF
ncbi:hypothetical protein K443DRAFT_9281 [Laccaria amethystina LaAM-08-1]|uniref:Uncharacterized protein n=1 Tax=Laccaria amethystina LaAM-08-1 TaxID=1095629 RepID=A0A0C9WMM8_9AGAR|nr:hypothetical protein K443DRAFT_9281 [Laccaria amethystina LaAM-08-1]